MLGKSTHMTTDVILSSAVTNTFLLYPVVLSQKKMRYHLFKTSRIQKLPIANTQAIEVDIAYALN